MGTVHYTAGRDQFDWDGAILAAINSAPRAVSTEGVGAPFYIQVESPVWFRMYLDGPNLEYNGATPGSLSAGTINYIEFRLQDNSTPVVFTFSPIDYTVMNAFLTGGGSLTTSSPEFLAVFAPEAMTFTADDGIGGADMFGSSSYDGFIGTDGGDFIVAGDSSDHVQGWDGNDTISGGFGEDDLFGEGGDGDVLDYSGEDYGTGIRFDFQYQWVYIDFNGGQIDDFRDFEIFRGTMHGDGYFDAGYMAPTYRHQGLGGGDTYYGGIIDYSADYLYAHTVNLGVVANFSATDIELSGVPTAGYSPEAWAGPTSFEAAPESTRSTAEAGLIQPTTRTRRRRSRLRSRARPRSRSRSARRPKTR